MAHAPAPDSIYIPSESLRSFMERVFAALGVPAEDARITADVLLEADLRGIDSHGIGRLSGIGDVGQNIHLVSVRGDRRLMPISAHRFAALCLPGNGGHRRFDVCCAAIEVERTIGAIDHCLRAVFNLQERGAGSDQRGNAQSTRQNGRM